MTERVWLPFAVHAGLAASGVAALWAWGWDATSLDAAGWRTPLLLANLGVLVGNGVAVALGRQRAAGDGDLARLGRREDLEDAHATAVEQLRRLELERDKLTPEHYARERAALLAVGAAALEGLHAAPTPASTSRPSPPASDLVATLTALRDADPAAFQAAVAQLGIRGQDALAVWRGAAYTAAGAGLIALLVALAGGDARDRRAGETMTGGDEVAMDRRADAEAPDARLQALEAKVAENPQDLDALHRLTEIHLGRQDLPAAMKTNDAALAIAPNDPAGRTYRAVLAAFVGKKEEALSTLVEIQKAHPTELRAWVYHGLLSLETSPKDALADFEKALTLEPTNPQLLAMREEAQRRVGGGGAATPSPKPPPSAAASEPAPDAVLAEGTVTLARPDAKGQVLFVSLRDPSQPGPPIAAVRLAPGPFPMAFRITGADRPMAMGRPMPANVELSVRLDADGDPMSRPPTDPSASQPIAVGATGISVTLP
jgi:tetratricopeptide (TPR) repeat protein